MALDESSTSTIAFIPSTQTDSAPHSTCSLLELEHLLPNIQSECPPIMMPSETDPMGGKEDHSSSWTFKSMPTLFGSYVARIPLTLQSPVTSLDSRLPRSTKTVQMKSSHRGIAVFPHNAQQVRIQLTMRGNLRIGRTKQRLGGLMGIQRR